MLITEIAVSNYKSFHGSSSITLKPGMTVVTGRNDAGKSALLEALSLQFSPRPHRTLKTAPTPFWEPPAASAVDFTCVLDRAELFQLLRNDNKDCALPVPDSSSDFAQRIGLGGVEWTHASCQRLAEWFMSQPEFTFALRRIAEPQKATISYRTFPSFGLYEAARKSDGRHVYAVFDVSQDGAISSVGVRPDAGAYDIGTKVGAAISSRVYKFAAERRCLGNSPFGASVLLSNDAANLPEVLNGLQHNPKRLEDYTSLVREVLPHVKWISVRPTDHGNEVLVWGVDRDTRRADLAVPLNESGTGVGHVLALLYVVCTSEFPQVILIDEPQSFLHPGAARKLIEVLRRYPQHQFVVSTHSPTIVNAADAESVLMVRKEAEDSKVDVIDMHNTLAVRASLSELGARLADVFGADNILWVEGPTEELCFPDILKVLCGRSMMGTVILSVTQTGDFESKNKSDVNRVFSIYNDLSTSGSLIPPAVAFIFDRECWSTSDSKEMLTRSKGLLRFTGRRTYENYLLEAPEGVATVINEFDPTRLAPTTADAVSKRLSELVSDDKYFAREGSCSDKTKWRITVDGARVLHDLFKELTDSRVEYRKTTHSTAITRWLLAHDPEKFRELATLIESVLPK